MTGAPPRATRRRPQTSCGGAAFEPRGEATRAARAPAAGARWPCETGVAC